jgi:hypothetical protein
MSRQINFSSALESRFCTLFRLLRLQKMAFLKKTADFKGSAAF